jgi:hypothetical protein
LESEGRDCDGGFLNLERRLRRLYFAGMNRIATFLAVAWFSFGVFADEEIAFNQLPLAVQTAVLPHLGAARIDSMRSANSEPERIYTIWLRQEQTWIELQIHENGSILSQTTRHAAASTVPRAPLAPVIQSVAELPLAVQKILWREGWLISQVEIEWTRLTFFDIDASMDGKAIPLRITEDGAILKRFLDELPPIEPPLENTSDVEPKDLPHAVRESISKQRSLPFPYRLARGEWQGELFYEAVFRGEDRDRQIRLAASGELAGLREGPLKAPEQGEVMVLARLPLIIRAVLEQRFPSVAVQEARRRITTVFHFTIRNEAGNETPIQIMEDGSLVKLAEVTKGQKGTAREL